MENFHEPATAAVTAFINLLPIGTILPYGGTAEKVGTMNNQGWMLCNGARLNKNQYPELFAVIGHSCGGTDPEFCLPDLRGMFLRGVDGAGADSHDPDNGSRKRQGSEVTVPNGVLTRQTDEFRKHSHTFPDQAFSERVFQCSGSGGYYFRVIEPKEGVTSETTGKETRPVNVSVNYIIFVGLPV